MKTEYPQEFYIKIDNNENLLGRITLNSIRSKFHIEIDIVFNESKKIFKHIGQEFEIEDSQEAVDLGVMKLSRYLAQFQG